MWHVRLGHVNFDKIAFMSKHDLIPMCFKVSNNSIMCMFNKITRTTFKSVERKSKILELIHIDLCDFHSTPSLENKKYVITFIDDSSNFYYVYLLHTKDESLNYFKIYKNEVEIQIGNKIKSLRTNKEDDYYDLTYTNLMGIIHETTTGYTP